MIPADVRQRLNQAHAVGDYAPLLSLIPYAGLIGIECERQGEQHRRERRIASHDLAHHVAALRLADLARVAVEDDDAVAHRAAGEL